MRLFKPNNKKMKEWRDSLRYCRKYLISCLVLEMEKIFSYIKGHPLKSLFFLFLALFPIAFLLMMWIGGVDDPVEAFFLTLPAVFGDIELKVLEERGNKVGVIAIFCLILNVCLLGIIFAGLTNYLCDLSSKGGPIRRRVKYNGHIVICGWN